jgi:hypothetical protein
VTREFDRRPAFSLVFAFVQVQRLAVVDSLLDHKSDPALADNSEERRPPSWFIFARVNSDKEDSASSFGRNSIAVRFANSSPSRYPSGVMTTS